MMHCVPNRLIAAAFIVMVAGCGTATETIAEGDRRLSSAAQAQLSENLSQWVAEYQAQDEIPGVAMAVVMDDEILLLETWGDRDLAQQLPVTPQTLFHIGSTHNPETAQFERNRDLEIITRPVVDSERQLITSFSRVNAVTYVLSDYRMEGDRLQLLQERTEIYDRKGRKHVIVKTWQEGEFVIVSDRLEPATADPQLLAVIPWINHDSPL